MPFAPRPRTRSLVLSIAAGALVVLGIHAAEPEKPAALDPVAYSTAPEVKSRLQRVLPHTFEKLLKRQPVSVIAVGDDLADMVGHGDSAGDQLQAWPAQFIMEIAHEFAYNGGLRLLQPNPGMPDKLTPGAGAEITLRVVPVTGSVLLKSVAAFASYATAQRPDILLVAASVHDAASGGDLMNIAESLHSLIEFAAAAKVDLILAGPPVNGAEPSLATLASTSTLTSLISDTATESSLPFIDLSDLAGIIRFNDDQTTAETAAAFVTHQLAQQFIWPAGITDWQHPVPNFHKRLSTLAYQHLTQGPSSVPWQISTSTTATVTDSTAVITCEISNPTKTTLPLTIQPLSLHAWLCDDKPLTLDLKPSAKLPLTFRYHRANAADSFHSPPLAAHEPLMRVPVFIGTATTARIEQLRATVQPLAILWKLDALFNQSKVFNLDNMLVNTTGKDLAGLNWTAEWAGQKKQGKVDLAAGKGATLPLTFDLPQDAGARRIASPIILTVNGNGISLNWVRAIEASQNIGLDQDIPLTSTTNSTGTAQLRVEADAKTATFLFDTAGLRLAAEDKITATLHLDARSYGKRLDVGSTEALTIRAGAADGDGIISPIAPWAFGTGYGMKFNPSGLSAKLSTDRTGHRLLKVTLPRSYLYLHEWAIGNGNSQIGLTAKLSTPTDTFELSLNGRNRDDAESHTALELTPKPTTRWSVIIW